jgi:tetratricopeptide (TPR) repeat protein
MECDANEACVALVEQAQKQSKAGQLAEAEKSYKLAYEVSHDARLLFNIARVLDKRGQGPEAQTYYRQFIEAPVEEPEQKAKAREYVAQLEAKNDPPPIKTAPLDPDPTHDIHERARGSEDRAEGYACVQEGVVLGSDGRKRSGSRIGNRLRSGTRKPRTDGTERNKCL